MKLLLLLLSVFVMNFQPALAQQSRTLTGDWKGYIDMQGNKLPIKTHFKNQNAKTEGTIEIQGTSLPLNNIKITTPDSVFFEFMTSVNVAKFKGLFENDSTIAGQFHQAGYTFSFELERYKPEAKTDTAKKAPLPYNHKDLIIKNDSINIGGTLTWPKDQKANQLVIMISGSGAQNRDEKILGFKIFGQIADYLTRHDIATFRYDDRGVGQSTGNFGNSTLNMLASDVEAVINYFKNKADQQFNQIILLGHSQGGMVGGRVAAEDKDVDKLILMSSPGVSLKKVLRFQVGQSFEQAGINDSLAKAEITARENLMQAIADHKQMEEAKKAYREQFRAVQISAGADSAQASAMAQRQANQLTAIYSSPQMQSLLFYDPAKDLRRLKIPVLVLFGGKDTQVPISLNKAPIQAALDSAGVPYQIKIVKNANHLYQKAKTGSLREYGSLKKQFTDGFLQTISRWIKKEY